MTVEPKSSSEHPIESISPGVNLSSHTLTTTTITVPNGIDTLERHGVSTRVKVLLLVVEPSAHPVYRTAVLAKVEVVCVAAVVSCAGHSVASTAVATPLGLDGFDEHLVVVVPWALGKVGPRGVAAKATTKATSGTEAGRLLLPESRRLVPLRLRGLLVEG